jgi:uncharacterized protein YbjT (DUF2867 family)
MILITGAAGKTGRAIIQALSNKEQSVRALVYRSEQRPILEQIGAAEVIVGDMLDVEMVLKATQNVRAIYHIAPNIHPEEVSIGQLLIKAAKHYDTERLVYHSVLHPQIESMPHHWLKMRVEELLFKSGLSFTILQPAVYMQNIINWWSDIVEDRIYRVPYATNSELAMVDLIDVAQVAATVLTEEDHSSAIYELVGENAISNNMVAQVLSQELGYEVAVESISITEWQENAKLTGMDNYEVETLRKMFEYYDRYGFSGNSKVLGCLLDRSPNSFRDFVRRIII